MPLALKILLWALVSLIAAVLVALGVTGLMPFLDPDGDKPRSEN